MRRVGNKVGVVFQQQSHPLVQRQLQVDAGALADALHQRLRNGHVAHLFAFTFHKHHTRAVIAAQRVPHQGVKPLLAGLRHARDRTQYRAAVLRQGFQIQHLFPRAL